MVYQQQGLFARMRSVVLVFILLFSVVVLGMSSHLASNLLPYDSNFIIFSLAVSGATLLAILTTRRSALQSTPSSESIGLFIFAVLWVAMGGYSQDRIGGVQCVELQGQTLNTGRNKTMSAQRHCEEVKVIMAFSWAQFAIFTIMFIIVIILTTRARTHGASSQVWNEPIGDLPWFGHWVGEDRQHYQSTYPHPMGMPMSPYPASPYGPGGAPQRIVIQAPPPGQSLVLRPEDGYAQPGVQPMMPAMSYRP